MTAPLLTVAIASHTGLPEARPLLEHLRQQSLAPRMVVVLVAPRGRVDPQVLQAHRGFAEVRLREVDWVQTRGEAVGVALLEATTPFLMAHENHAFPDPGTLERLVMDRDPEDAAVAPAFRSANPETCRSLVMLLGTYGSVAFPIPPGDSNRLPYHNAVWTREALHQFGDRLPELLQDEGHLQEAVRATGARLRVHPSAVTWHINESRWLEGLATPFYLGRRFNGERALSWSGMRRCLHVVATPVIGGLVVVRLIRDARRIEDTRGRWPQLVPMMLVHAAAWAIGEAVGALTRVTSVPLSFEVHEFHIRGRLGRVRPRTAWVQAITDQLPVDLA